MGSSDKLSIKTVFNANKTIWGQSLGKWAGVFKGDVDMASFTLCETLNKIYGIANEDISQTVNNSINGRHGVLSNFSKYMYLFNSVPDYFNRLTLFVAKMMEDGCFEAHTLDEDGNLSIKTNINSNKWNGYSFVCKYIWDNNHDSWNTKTGQGIVSYQTASSVSYHDINSTIKRTEVYIFKGMATANQSKKPFLSPFIKAENPLRINSRYNASVCATWHTTRVTNTVEENRKTIHFISSFSIPSVPAIEIISFMQPNTNNGMSALHHNIAIVSFISIPTK